MITSVKICIFFDSVHFDYVQTSARFDYKLKNEYQ